MFFGFLIVMCVLAPFFLFFQFVLPALVAHGQTAAAFLILAIFYFGLIYLGGFARFRALRYRLARTYWHGIRGGSDNPGWSYGGEYFGRVFLAAMTMWIAWPWMAVQLWNARWNKMSFGPLQFESELRQQGLGWPWALVYLVPLGGLILGGLLLGGAGILTANSGNPVTSASFGVLALLVFLLVYLAVPLMTLNWYAKYFRMAARSTRIGDLEFSFDATTLQWLGLILGNLGLAVVTLGFGLTSGAIATGRSWFATCASTGPSTCPTSPSRPPTRRAKPKGSPTHSTSAPSDPWLRDGSTTGSAGTRMTWLSNSARPRTSNPTGRVVRGGRAGDSDASMRTAKTCGWAAATGRAGGWSCRGTPRRRYRCCSARRSATAAGSTASG